MVDNWRLFLSGLSCALFEELGSGSDLQIGIGVAAYPNVVTSTKL
jgi:hypothetical protein